MFAKIYEKQLMQPNILGVFFNPFYFDRMGLYKNIKRLGKEITGKTLDIGCGKKPYENLFASSEYIGMDMETTGHNHRNSKIDVFYDGKTFPFSDNAFDSVVTNQVLEHVFNPSQFLSEINRVLKSGGKMLITVPFVWDEHEQPYDFGRYTSFGIKDILEKHGFQILEQIKTVNDLGAIFQLLNMYYYKTIVRKNVFSKVFAMIIIVPTNIVGVIISAIFPKNDDLYLGNVVLSEKVKRTII